MNPAEGPFGVYSAGFCKFLRERIFDRPVFADKGACDFLSAKGNERRDNYGPVFDCD